MKKKTNEEIVLPAKIAVFDDKKSGAKTVAFPFVFLDGTSGVVSVTRLKNEIWIPQKDIKSVIINWNES
jgi:hypothetical protein